MDKEAAGVGPRIVDGDTLEWEEGDKEGEEDRVEVVVASEWTNLSHFPNFPNCK